MMPDSAQRKLALLTQQTEDSRALAVSAKERAGVLEAKVIQLHNAHAPATEISRAAEQHEEALDVMMARKRTWDGREQVLAKLRSWIAELPHGTRLEPAPNPLLNVNDKAGIAVAAIRRQLADLVAEFHRLTAAGPNRDDAKQQIQALVQSLAAKGRPRIDVQRGEVRVSGWGDGLSAPTPHSVTVNFMAWLAPHLMVDALTRELEAVPVDAHALPLDQRKVRLAEIEAEIALLEIREEAAIIHGASQGTVIERRFDQSPASILGLRLASATARAA